MNNIASEKTFPLVPWRMLAASNFGVLMHFPLDNVSLALSVRSETVCKKLFPKKKSERRSMCNSK